ncbi:MAG TPA: TIGR01777 family oxidoreductase [Rhabdochlamydiaceae bacterium]|jgi:hypothetical protein
MQQFSYSSEMPYPAEEVFAWHLRKGAIERMIPPWKKVFFLFPPGSPQEEGSQVALKVSLGPFSFKWILRHERISKWEFSDVQLQGPFKKYRHTHEMIPHGSSCTLREKIHCESYLPNAWLEREFSRLFSWRHALLKEDLKLFNRYRREPMRILLSGSHGLIGSHLKVLLETAGHDVTCLVRLGGAKKEENAVCWDPTTGTLCKEDFEGFDAVIHLAGESIASKKWDKRQKHSLFLSRCRDTWLLSQVLCRLYRPPQTVITASAIGFYGDRGSEELTEESPAGRGFLPELCTKWEEATHAIEQRGSRVAQARFGMVLSAKGGALARLLLPYKLGLGGRLGSGAQIVSWVGIDDAIGALYHILMEESLSGPVNVVAPKPLRQKEFADILAKKLYRKAWMPLPASLLRWAFGEMGEELLLSSQNVKPQKLLETQYAFRYPDLSQALDFVM